MEIQKEQLVYTVFELACILKIGLNKAYKLVRTPGFPVIKNGQNYLIPKDSLREWLKEQAKEKSYGNK